VIAPRLFRSAVRLYVSGRLDYPPELIAEVTKVLALGTGDRVLDLGCGPGFLALGFAPYVGEVVAVDPEPRMLVAARTAARARKRRLTLLRGSSETIGPALGRFRLAVMGRSFHLMDRRATLDRLDELIQPGGGVALFGDNHPQCPENAWVGSFDNLRHAFAPERGSWSTGGSASVAALRASPFAAIRHLSYSYRRRTPVDMLVSRALSMSRTSPQRLGQRRAEFEATLRAALGPFAAADGSVTEVVEAEAVLAQRPEEAPGTGSR
jgi:SAM-dependent methyltransferase